MIVLEEKHVESEVHSRCESALTVEPADISFQNLSGRSVLVRVRIRNDSAGRSSPTVLRLESAPLGAFVPWRPLAVLSVPALEPGKSLELNYEASRPQPMALGSFDRVPPRSILTALDASPDEPAPQPGGAIAAMLNSIRGRDATRTRTRRAGSEETSLAPDLWDLVGREQPHWAGNINVFIGAKAVERHLARGLRIYPGRFNMAMFLVGGGGHPDAYAFEVAGLPSRWQAALYDFTGAKTLVVGSGDSPLGETQWVESGGTMMVLLAVRPPAGCNEGHAAIHVTRRSDGKKATVEFDLDPSAQGAGCYAV